MRSYSWILAMTLTGQLACLPASARETGNAAAKDGGTLFVLDGSGSMWGQIDGEPKIAIARKVMGDLVGRLPPDVKAGLLVYGHNRKDDCKDIQMVAPPSADHTKLLAALGTINPKGMTPITSALQQAVEQFRQSEGAASVVLVTDGKETCGGDPCAAAREAVKMDVNLRIHVIGFDVTSEESKELTCIADEGHGKYFAADSAEQLVSALDKVEQEVVAPIPSPPPKTADEILFEDHFERDALGDNYEVVDPDPDRAAMMDGKLLLIGTKGIKNKTLLNREIKGDFVATVKFNSLLTNQNRAGMVYEFSPNTRIEAYVWKTCCNWGRWLYFDKTLKGKRNEIAIDWDDGQGRAKVGDRPLSGDAEGPEDWFVQIERIGVKYTARISTDGKQWTEVGTHTLLQKGGRMGFEASAGGGTENSVEFDDFVLKGKR